MEVYVPRGVRRYYDFIESGRFEAAYKYSLGTKESFEINHWEFRGGLEKYTSGKTLGPKEKASHVNFRAWLRVRKLLERQRDFEA